MQTVVLSILILGCLSTFIKLSFAKPWGVGAWTAAAAVATGLAGRWAATQSKTQIADFLSNPVMMADVAVLLTVEVSIMVAFCLQRVQTAADPPNHHPFQGMKQIARILVESYPGSLLFIAMFCLLSALMFRMTGVSFTRISWTVGAALAALVPTAVWGVRKLFPQQEQRLELLFILNIAIAVLSVVATVNGRTAVEGTGAVDWLSLSALLALVLTLALLGWGIRKIRSKKLTH